MRPGARQALSRRIAVERFQIRQEQLALLALRRSNTRDPSTSANSDQDHEAEECLEGERWLFDPDAAQRLAKQGEMGANPIVVGTHQQPPGYGMVDDTEEECALREAAARALQEAA